MKIKLFNPIRFLVFPKFSLIVFLVFSVFYSMQSSGLNITIIESQSSNPGHDMDIEWSAVVSSMGHIPTILPQTALDNNTFFASTDILIVSSGVIVLPANRIATILQFIQSGKPAYIQAEYLSTMGGSIIFESLVTSLGGTFAWSANFSGDLQPMNVLGTFATTNNIVPSINYFWYSVAGIGDCNLINILEYSGMYHGFQYLPTNPAYGSIITTTDQDWIRATTSPMLMQNLITHLINPGQASNGPPISLGNDTTLCTGTIITLDATTAGATYLWQDNSTNPTLNVTQTGTYWVEVSANGCVSVDTIEINYSGAPFITLGNDSTLCDGQALTLNATTAGATYLWQDNSTNATFNVTQTGIYIVNVTTSCGTATDTVDLTFNPLPVFTLGNDTTLCQGETVLLDVTTPGATYLWNDNSVNSTFNVSQSGTYSVEITVNGCSSVDSTVINFNTLPIVNLGVDTILCQGQTNVLDATTLNATYVWQDNTTGSQLTVSQPGIYWVEVTVNGCSSIDSIQVDFNPLPVVNLGNPTGLCAGQSLFLDVTTPNATYLWQDNSTNPTYTITQSGTYFVQVTVNGCSASDTINAIFNPLPVVSLGSDIELCDGQTTTLNAATANGSYLWQDNSNSSTFNVTQSGTYWVTVTVNSCTSSDTIVVNYSPLPVVSFGSDLTLCSGQTTILDAANANGVYIWQDNSTGSNYTVSQPGTYWVLVTVNNCSSTDTINVNYNPLPVFTLGNDVTVCDGETVTLDATTANASYLWSDNSTNATNDITQSGNYSVIVTVSGCSSSDTANVIFNQLPLVNLGSDTVGCEAEPIILNATFNGASYLWQDNSTNSTYTVTETGLYAVTVTANNCTTNDQINIVLENCNVVLEMPNIFTPNQDGNNDTFYPIKMEGITQANLIVFNRWGLEVFRTDDLLAGWNGECQNELCTDGTFLWIVEYSTVRSETLNQKGTVMMAK